MNKTGILLFFCGKMGVGKSTHAQKLKTETGAILFSEDQWLAAMYPKEIMNFDDYIKYSLRLKAILKEHVTNLLESGLTVIMDFPGNTIKQRTWFSEIMSNTNCNHKLIYLKAEDELCLRQIEKRSISDPKRAHFDTKEVFNQVTSYFQEPTIDEGFHIEIIEK